MFDTLLTFARASCETKGISLIPTWHKYLPKDNECRIQTYDPDTAPDGFRVPDDLPSILFAIVEILLRVGTFVAIGFIIYAGFMYLTSQGEPDKAAGAQKTLINAIIGLVITIIATGLMSFLAGQLTK